MIKSCQTSAVERVPTGQTSAAGGQRDVAVRQDLAVDAHRQQQVEKIGFCASLCFRIRQHEARRSLAAQAHAHALAFQRFQGIKQIAPRAQGLWPAGGLKREVDCGLCPPRAQDARPATD